MKIIIVTLFIALAVYPNSVELMSTGRQQDQINAAARTCIEVLAAGANLRFVEEEDTPDYLWYKDERTGFHRIIPNSGHFLFTWKGITMGRIDGDLLKPIYMKDFENGGRFIIVLIDRNDNNNPVEFDEASARQVGVFGPWRNIMRTQREQIRIVRAQIERAERELAERESAERERAESSTERGHAESSTGRERSESSTERERAERERAEKERAESSAERERAERESAEKERAEMERSG